MKLQRRISPRIRSTFFFVQEIFHSQSNVMNLHPGHAIVPAESKKKLLLHSIKVSLIKLKTFFIYLSINNFSKTVTADWKKKTVIKRLAVQETGISRHHESPLKPLWTSLHYRIKRFKKGALNWVPITQRDACLADSYTSDRCCFSSLAVS